MDKEVVVLMYNGISLSHKWNEIELFVVKWMDLESVIQSEVRKKKTKYRMLTHVYIESKTKKNGSDEPRGRIGIKTQT